MRIYLHGNCQMPAMASLLRELATSWTIDITEVGFSDLERDEPTVRSHLRHADVVIAQPVSPGYRDVAWLGLDFVKAEMRPGAQLLLMPSIFYRGEIPDWFYLGRSGERLIVQGLPYHNAVVAEGVLLSCPTAQIVNRVTSVLLYGPRFIEAQINRSLAELRIHEARASVNIPVSGMIADLYPNNKVMATIDHPQRFLLARVINYALSLLSEPYRVSESGPYVLGDDVLPTTPAVAASLGHRLDSSLEMVVAGRPVAIADYLAGAIREYRALDPTHLASLIFGNRAVRGFLSSFSRHQQDRSTFETEAAASLIRGLYEVLLNRSPGPKEVLSHLQTAAAADGRTVIKNFLSSGEFQARRDSFLASLSE